MGIQQVRRRSSGLPAGYSLVDEFRVEYLNLQITNEVIARSSHFPKLGC